MTANILFAVVPFLAGGINFKYLDIASRVFWAVTALSFVGESAACFAALRYRNNLPVYAVLGPLETAGICIYFNYAVDFLRKYKAGIVLAITCMVSSACCILFSGGMLQVNTRFILAQAVLICLLSVLLMGRQVFGKDPENVRRFPHYWFAALLVLLWVSVAIHLLYYQQLTVALPRMKTFVDGTLIAANLFYNAAIASIFVFHKRCLKYAG